MDDIVKRLRGPADNRNSGGCQEAADEIEQLTNTAQLQAKHDDFQKQSLRATFLECERLAKKVVEKEAEIERLREALELIVSRCGNAAIDEDQLCLHPIDMIARAALKQ